ncbi:MULTISPECIES: enoyl-CoA hydratase/isomerase family protein [Bradyrhizobium]|jgi:enoyl-CoA hydratase/carnithine racemase|uniref:enoyl-CoA hydratase/isomerase family protein n=1 Tax=Bradyrhizobium TaxID=374 RepID=UPI000486C5CB|nr:MULTISPECIES: enoyl-CoA hydratase/isomerase family protein [Bradyrhizobium]MCS3446491.1 enoyl-CoA hydratase/carnithine racemase [Bradyrhizobium elkanii]MCS3562375.1 enoyl-CoA hydratase/carnithine racemase [Bradyrhizobium elkanii]MCW2147787.1 enoyl-CoA hydratase/carnithine racemase [Bradyrhizobium elkanii]MCW2353129.1 enoyl-CoA hydratase/carnithine racemase [Bradyrhizobium elkanii]MCW2371513.1 enoyl-CoA hydratase/carnithine racemase [Bradyrhizobium elkanii]
MIKLDNQGPIAIVTINRAERRNALGSQLVRDLNAALADSERNDAISAVVLTGAPPAFCAGSDLKELAGLSIADMCKHEAETATFARAIGYRAKPVIAAVEGYALGGGMILAASCDIVVAASNARWHLPEAPNGWLPPWGLTALLTRVGPVRARRLTWGAASIDTIEAARIGLVDEVAEPGAALSLATEIAVGLSKVPPEAVASTKRFFDRFIMADAERLDEVSSREFASNCETPSSQKTFERFTVKS